MKVAYIIGPYRAKTIYQIKQNIYKAEEIALKYWKLGYAVICPHKNSAFFDGECEDEIWLKGGIEILKRCDICIVIDGWQNSEGSRREIDAAYEFNIEIIEDYR